MNTHSEFSLKCSGTLQPAVRWLRTHNFEGITMTKFAYLLAAAATIAIATPAFAQDAPKPGVTINQGSAPTGEVKRDEGRSQEGREMRKEGGRDHGRMEAREEHRDGDRGEMRGEHRSVELGDRDRGERRWHRAHAESLVIIHHHHRRHHHEM
jgi:hypothetical protein